MDIEKSLDNQVVVYRAEFINVQYIYELSQS